MGFLIFGLLIGLVLGVGLGFWFSGQQIERQKQFYEDESRKLRDELERNYQSRMAATIDSLRKDHENQLSKKTEELQQVQSEISSLKATYQTQTSQEELKDSSLDVKDVSPELGNPMVEDTISSTDDSSIAEIVDNSDSESINITPQTDIEITSETPTENSGESVIISETITDNITTETPVIESVNLTSENTAENLSDTRENQQEELIQTTIIQSSEADTILEGPEAKTATNTKKPVVIDDEGWETIPDEHPSEISLLIVSNSSDESDLPVIEETEEYLTENLQEISDLSVIDKEDMIDNISEKLEEKATFIESLSIGELTQYIYHPDSKIRTLLATNLGKIVGENKRLIPQIITILAKLTRDTDSTVRQSAIASLADIKSPQVIPLITKGLKDTDLDVVKISSDAMSNFKFYRVNKIKKISPKMVKR